VFVLVFCTQLGRAPILGAAGLTVGGGGVWAWWRDLRVCFGRWDWAGCGPVFGVFRTGFLHPIGAWAHIGCSRADCGWWWCLGMVSIDSTGVTLLGAASAPITTKGFGSRFWLGSSWMAGSLGQGTRTGGRQLSAGAHHPGRLSRTNRLGLGNW